MDKRNPIPSDVKRRLRQESGFGCCKCGKPIIEYHHIIPYTKIDPHFRVEDMMCLCPYCHHEATVGAMNLEEQRKLKNHPLNIRNKKAEGFLKVNQNSLVITLGDNQFITDNSIISIDNNNLISIKINSEGQLELSLKLYNKENKLILEIVENEWKSGDYLPWDIESSFQWLIIRNKKYDISIEINAKQIPLILTGKLWYNNHEIKISPNGIFFNAKKSSGQISNLCFVGSNLELDTNLGTFSICPHPIYNKHSMVPGVLENRISTGLQKFKEIITTHNSGLA
ncbi:HNH endonuclease signature motif containing protein [Cytophagales bacterium LB-30]|uniref:HNH endonuclease signature motif containing protein n=1 Tax=Shiella aurantiaca TaxID=3058365 RepID=A0ABT8F866_9BACT|nr:HNH endonuclease signature motif containing protein [Shiella aurantiaca]MDN4166666.1 HNH endonuclease signature motif containing protein [Shiella aurantiaca]